MEATVLTRTFNVDYGCNGGRTALYDRCLDLLKSNGLLRYIDLNTEFGGVVYYLDNDSHVWMLLAGIPTGRQDKVGSEIRANIVLKGETDYDDKKLRLFSKVALRTIHERTADKELLDAISIENNGSSTFVPVENLLNYLIPTHKNFYDIIDLWFAGPLYGPGYMMYTTSSIMAAEADDIRNNIKIAGMIQTPDRWRHGIDPVITEAPKGFFAKLFGRK